MLWYLGAGIVGVALGWWMDRDPLTPIIMWIGGVAVYVLALACGRG